MAYHEVDDDEVMAPALIEAKELVDCAGMEPVAERDLVEEIE